MIGRYAGLSLAPFARTLGADLFLAVEPVLGLYPAIAFGLATCGLALLFWYGLEALKAGTIGDKERTMMRQEPEHERTLLETKIEQMLTEACVMLPGAQAFLSFQLVITCSEAFEKLPVATKVVHLMTLGFLALTVVWLMAPAAFHRIVYAGEDIPEFHTLRQPLPACRKRHPRARHRERSRGRGREGRRVGHGGCGCDPYVPRSAGWPLARASGAAATTASCHVLKDGPHARGHDDEPCP